MALLRMDNVLLVVDDMEAVKAFLAEVGMEVEGETTVDGGWVGDVIGLSDVRCDICVMRTPDGHGKVELSKFHNPEAFRAEPEDTPSNAFGLRRIMFAVDNLDGVVAGLQRNHGATLVGEVVNFQNVYRLCYIRGPEGIVLGLAEPQNA